MNEVRAGLHDRRSRMRFGDVLVSQGVVGEEDVERALEAQKERTGVRIGRVLIELGAATEEEVAAGLARHLNLPFEKIDQYIMDPEVRKLIPAELAARYLVFPLFSIKRRLSIAMSDPLDVFALDAIRNETNLQVDVVVSTESDIEQALKQYYGGSMEAVLTELEEEIEIDREAARADVVDVTAMASAAEEAPVVKLLNSIFVQALRESASDIHIEPDENALRIRYRIDGALREVKGPSVAFHAPLVSRVKLIANLDIAEKRVPQDGRVRIRLQDRVVDLRVSVMPTLYGEKAVIRILDLNNAAVNLEALGLNERAAERMRHQLASPTGILLATGPTGSGKTTTLYACLQELNNEKVNILTVEDPVEYHVGGVNQIQVNPKAGLTFASALRSILRQDPDIIMVGEIRDKETVEIAVQAALTGHFVLSTLHTNDAARTITRLIQMGIEPYLIAASLSAIVAQRLVRMVCGNCREHDDVPNELREKLGIESSAELMRGRGCKECGGTGYRGRTGLYEILETSEALQEMIVTEASAREIRRQAEREGMSALRSEGMIKVSEGITTLDEVLRVTQGDM